MNRQEWETQVFESDLNPTARVICLAIGSHGNWTKDQTVFPSRQRISSMTGASRDTVNKYMTALEEQGWLKVVQIRKDNVREYELSTPNQVVVDYGILGIKKRGSTSGLKNQVVVDNEQVVVDYDKQVVVDDELGCRNLRQEPTRNLPEEPTIEPTNTTTAPKAAVVKEVREPKEDTYSLPDPSLTFRGAERSAGATLTAPPMVETVMDTSANAPVSMGRAKFNERGMFTAFLTWKRYLDVEESYENRVKELVMDRSWNPQEDRPNFRLSLAAHQINEERGLL